MWGALAPPLAERLRPSRRVLIAGAGGGFDVYAGLPLFLALRAEGIHVALANLSFTYLGGTSALPLEAGLYAVDHTTSGEPRYFPEGLLARWLHAEGHPSRIWCFEKVGVRPLRRAYGRVLAEEQPDTLILVDGGTDILMKGDEAGLGTPAEDMASLAAVSRLDVPNRLVSCLGFGVDAHHGVCHAHFLENVAALERRGGFLGAHSLHLGMPMVAAYRDAVEHAHRQPSGAHSIVNGSIASALEGRFGDFHRTPRTHRSELFINPLMTPHWHFDLGALAAERLYLSWLEDTETLFEVEARIEAFRASATTRPRRGIPC